MTAKVCVKWEWYVTVSLIVMALVTLAAVVSRLWVLTAIPIGFLFGFFLQKGDLCGASAFSEVLLLKDWKKDLGAVDLHCGFHGWFCRSRSLGLDYFESKADCCGLA